MPAKPPRRLPLTHTLLAAALLLFLLLAATPPTAEAASYVLGPRDILSIAVYEEEDLTQEVRIAGDGHVTLPLVGPLKAAGATVEEFEALLVEKYKEFIREPQVQVFVKEYHSKEISVLGEVSRPGLYKLTGNTTLLEVLSIVGGLTPAHADHLVVLRQGTGEEEPVNIAVDTRALFTPAGMSLNIQVLDGDVIHVPKREKETATFYLFGEVRKPGPYQLPPNTRLTVIKAISLAGGFTERASKGKIKIKREAGDEVKTFRADMDTEVRAQDIVIVPQSFF